MPLIDVGLDQQQVGRHHFQLVERQREAGEVLPVYLLGRGDDLIYLPVEESWVFGNGM